MRKALASALLGLVLCFSGVTELAASPTDTTGEAAGCLGDHWSFFDVVAPALRQNLCGMLGTSFIEGEPVTQGVHIPMALLVSLVCVFLALLTRRGIAKSKDPVVPDSHFSVRTFFELLIKFILDTMTSVMGEKRARYHLPFIAGLAVFILFSNLAGLVPGLLPPTESLNTTFALATLVFFATHIAGVREQKAGYLKHFLGPIIKWYALPLMIIMFVIETISHLVRPMSLSLRLMGNMVGKHKVVTIFLGFNILFVPLPIMALGLLVAAVQTFVFCLLATIYLALAVEHEEDHS